MSDLMAAVLIVPFLVALVVVLECSRTGCTWLTRQYRNRRTERSLGLSAVESPASGS